MNLGFNSEKNILSVFATPIGQFEVPNKDELNPPLLEAILKREKESRGQAISNMGGWHSKPDLLDWPEPEIAQLREIIQSAVTNMMGFVTQQQGFQTQLGFSAWANVNRENDYNMMHIHPNNHWSGVYYVKTGDLANDPAPRAGCIEFLDPRAGAGMFPHPADKWFGKAITLQPKEGLLLLFPSWLYHGVNPFKNSHERVSIAFNARIMAFKPAGQ